MYNLEQMLNSITGMTRTTLQPTAGSQGEFVGPINYENIMSLREIIKK